MTNRGLRVAAVLAIGVVVLLSVIPGHLQVRTEAPKIAEHFAAYLLAALVFMWAFGSPVRAPIVVACLVALSGALEIAQLWVPGRTAAFEDWAASSLGALAGVAAALLLSRMAGRTSPVGLGRKN